MHRLRLQLLRFIANNSFAPLRAPTIPTRSPLRPCSRALPFLCIVHGKYGPVSIGACACCDLIDIHGIYIYIYIQWTPTNFRFYPNFPPIFCSLFVFKKKFCEYFSCGDRNKKRLIKRDDESTRSIFYGNCTVGGESLHVGSISNGN